MLGVVVVSRKYRFATFMDSPVYKIFKIVAGLYIINLVPRQA